MNNSSTLQLRIDELKKEKTLKEIEINHLASANQKLREKINDLNSVIEKQKKLFLSAIENATETSRVELELAKKLRRDSEPELINSEREINAQLTEENMILFNKLNTVLQIIDKCRNNQDDIDVFDAYEYILLIEKEIKKA